MADPDDCPASKNGVCLETWRDGKLTSCPAGECAEEAWGRYAVAARAEAPQPMRATRKPKRGRLPSAEEDR